MVHSYDKLYLSRAQSLLAVMLDNAVNSLGYELESFYHRFLASPVASRFESGDCAVLAGRSGMELLMEVLDSSESLVCESSFERTPEYWTGWALAYFQWYCGLGFSRINFVIPIDEVRMMYHPYHEMDITQFCDHMLDLYRLRSPEASLKRVRSYARLSQADLAKYSGVPLRTIQQYEQRQKNINNAKAETLLRLARTIGCRIEDLLEV